MTSLVFLFILFAFPADGLSVPPEAMRYRQEPGVISAPDISHSIQLPASDSLRIVVLGSSTAAGAGPSTLDSAWVWRYRAYLTARDSTARVINLARGGYTSYHILPTATEAPEGRPLPDTLRNITHALSLRPSAIIINLPSNDAAKDYSIIEQSGNFERVAEEAAWAGIPLWVCTTQPRNLSEDKRLNLVIMRDWIMTTYADYAVDFWNGLAEDGGVIAAAYDSGDGVHLNDAGHALLFSRIVDADISTRIGESTGIPMMETPQLALELFPNPVQDAATVLLDIPAATSYSLRVLDMLGRTVLQQPSHVSSSGISRRHLDVSHLSDGVYILLLSTQQHTVHNLLIIAR